MSGNYLSDYRNLKSKPAGGGVVKNRSVCPVNAWEGERVGDNGYLRTQVI